MDSNSAVIACGGSRRVHKIVHLAVKKGHIISENIHCELLSLINPAVYLLNIIFVG